MHDFPYLQIFLLLTSVWVIGRIFQRFNWPPLFGEILAGIILGPVLLDVVQTNDALSVMAELGVFFLMLHAGLEASPCDLFKASKKAVLVALGGSILPFLGGYLLASLFGYELEHALFLGLGASITSIVVSTKLFKDSKILQSDVANVTMVAAIITDILGLILFSVVLDVANDGFNVQALLVKGVEVALFFAVVMFVGHKFFKQLNKVMYVGNKGFTFTIILALAFGLVAEMLGLHIIIGAFLAGLFIREEVIENKLFEKIEDRIFGVSYSFLGPIFFASLAFNLNFSAFKTAPVFVVLFILTAIVTKVAGAGLVAYWSKLGKVKSLAVGLSMNSRGAVDLVIASIGLSSGIISQEIFSILVVGAFVSTFVSIVTMKPLVSLIAKGESN